MEYLHACIKCQSQYTDSDPDPYYCEKCNEVKKAIADQVNKKIATRPVKQVKSDFQKYEEAPKAMGRFMILTADDL